jgi:hypothetical protein
MNVLNTRVRRYKCIQKSVRTTIRILSKSLSLAVCSWYNQDCAENKTMAS